jgi:hypothetical protein
MQVVQVMQVLQVVLIVQDLQDSKAHCKTKRKLHRMNPLLGEPAPLELGVGSWFKQIAFKNSRIFIVKNDTRRKVIGRTPHAASRMPPAARREAQSTGHRAQGKNDCKTARPHDRKTARPHDYNITGRNLILKL